MTKFTNPFVLPNDEYKRDIQVLKHYAKDVAMYLHTSTGKSLESCENYVRAQLSKGGKYEFKDKPIKFLERAKNGDRVETTGGLNSYLQDSIRKEQLIAPTLTTYINPKEKQSLLATYVSDNIKARSKAKKEMFAAKAEGSHTLEAIKKLEQTNRKLANNAISGAHVSPSTPLYNKTAHSTLTSNCRSTSGYGNANNEKFLSGNRHYFNHHIVLNNIISIVNHTDYTALEQVVNKYNIHIPTEEETLECVTYSSNIYWKSERHLIKIKSLINKLSGLQRAAFVYTGDMYHLKKHNDLLLNVFLTQLSTKVEGSHVDPLSVIQRSPEDHVNLAHQICSKETMGIGKNYDKIKDTYKINTLALTVESIASVLTKYSDLIKTLWVTKNLPASVAHFPTSIRRSALTSDTDSTIFTVQDWITWKKGGISFDEEATAFGAAIVFLASATITHVLAIMSSNFGIGADKLNLIAMKNEFKFEVFVPTQLGKHYFANISSQEGNVFEELEMEIKGVHLKSSNSPKNIVVKATSMMKSIMDDVMTRGSINATQYLKQVADTEREIIASIHKGEHTYFRGSSIKDAASYTLEKELSPYAKHVFWNKVFGPKYGIMPEPPYGTMKIAVTTDNTSKFKEWVESIQDVEFKNRLKDWMVETDRKVVTTFYIPTNCLTKNGLPEELKSIVDYRRIIRDCCGMFYIILETLGIYISGDRLTRIVSDDY